MSTRPFSKTTLLLILSIWALVCSCSPTTETGEPATPSSMPLIPTHTFQPPPTDTPILPTKTPTPVPSNTPIIPTETPIPVPSNTPDTKTDAPPTVYTYKVVGVYPHQRNAFTQGLVYLDSIFYEGTGLRGQSTLRKVDPKTGQVLQYLALPPQYFGEGVAVFGDRILQLTWQSHIGFVYDRESFELLGTFDYPTEGWGLTHDGRQLLMSDGTATLHFLDPETLEETGQIQVYDDNGPVIRLNELEYIDGEVYANVWQTDRIARIDPQSGRVTGWIELDGLLGAEDRDPPVDVLNGIAYDADNDRLFLTGKLWPKLFEIELVPVDN